MVGFLLILNGIDFILSCSALFHLVFELLNFEKHSPLKYLSLNLNNLNSHLLINSTIPLWIHWAQSYKLIVLMQALLDSSWLYFDCRHIYFIPSYFIIMEILN